MTLKEKIICTAYTGVNFCQGYLSDEYNEFLKYAEKLMDRPVKTIEMAYQGYWDKLRELSKPDFGRMIQGEYKDEWIPVTESVPQTNLHVMVTTREIPEVGDSRFIREAFIDSDGIWEMIGHHFTDDETVIAWAPLPEPYKEGRA